MTNFTKKQQAEFQLNLGKGQNILSNTPTPIRDKLFPKGNRQRKLILSKASAKNVVEGTIKKNRIKKGLPRLRRPPAAKKEKK